MVKQIPRKKVIQAKDIVNDIRAGLTEDELMHKYHLSSRGLRSAYEKLLQKRIMTVHEIYGQPRSEGDDTVIVEDMRQLRRHYLTVEVPIYVADSTETQGLLRDITERGLGISGIQVKAGETKSFVVPTQRFLKIPNVRFEARCLWVNSPRGSQNWSAGFQITRISPKGLVNLRDLIKGLTLDE
jgi:hypothetical protein